jgi:hypothetical protein
MTLRGGIVFVTVMILIVRFHNASRKDPADIQHAEVRPVSVAETGQDASRGALSHSF